MIKEKINPTIHPLKHAYLVNTPIKKRDNIGAQNKDIKL